ncbi:hypothetical protein F4803DRAFT_527863 [Xylaria telfairii]|nr:hypothetical protein F4803DRAFT_527863 [Xylaria telfairii]
MYYYERDDPRGWGGGVVGSVRWKGCTHREHYALVFRRDVDTSLFPDKLNGYRTRLPVECDKRTPRVNRLRWLYPYGEESPAYVLVDGNEEVWNVPVNSYYPPNVAVADWGGYGYTTCDRSRLNEFMRNDAWESRIRRGGSRNLRRQGYGSEWERWRYLG